MDRSKPITSPLAPHFKLSTRQCPLQMKRNKKWRKSLYALVVGSLCMLWYVLDQTLLMS